MGLCYLTSLYAFIRGAAGSSRGWWWVSFLSCVVGMASKEVMVTAPVVIFFYDRTFVSGTFVAAWRRHKVYYLGLAASWLLLALLMTGLSQRDVGFNRGVSWWSYALAECQAVLVYLKLILLAGFFLVFDYGPIFSQSWLSVISMVVLVGPGGAPFWRHPRLGFLVLTFLVLLAPTSSFVPVAGQPMAENRTYLPSITLLTAGVIGLVSVLGRRALWVCLAMALSRRAFRPAEHDLSNQSLALGGHAGEAANESAGVRGVGRSSLRHRRT